MAKTDKENGEIDKQIQSIMKKRKMKNQALKKILSNLEKVSNKKEK